MSLANLTSICENSCKARRHWRFLAQEPDPGRSRVRRPVKWWAFEVDLLWFLVYHGFGISKYSWKMDQNRGSYIKKTSQKTIQLCYSSPHYSWWHLVTLGCKPWTLDEESIGSKWIHKNIRNATNWWFPKLRYPCSSSILKGIFPEINHPAVGVPHVRKPPYKLKRLSTVDENGFMESVWRLHPQECGLDTQKVGTWKLLKEKSSN